MHNYQWCFYFRMFRQEVDAASISSVADEALNTSQQALRLVDTVLDMPSDTETTINGIQQE